MISVLERLALLVYPYLINLHVYFNKNVMFSNSIIILNIFKITHEKQETKTICQHYFNQLTLYVKMNQVMCIIVYLHGLN